MATPSIHQMIYLWNSFYVYGNSRTKKQPCIRFFFTNNCYTVRSNIVFDHKMIGVKCFTLPTLIGMLSELSVNLGHKASFVI